MRDLDLADLALQAIEKAFAPALALLRNEPAFCIYGAGETGRLLFELCKREGMRPTAFLDDHSPESSSCGASILPVKEGIETNKPTAILLGSICSTERMQANLRALPYTGRILGVMDTNAHMRSPHCSYRITPQAVLRRFHNCHKGERAFVIGNGPSLPKTDPRQLTRDITFAANNIFLLEEFTPSYYAVMDPLIAQQRTSEINALPWVKFFPHPLSEWMGNGYFLNAVQSDWPDHFSTDIAAHIQNGFSVTFFLLQIAFYMGCDPVYLIGVDHTYNEQTARHYHDGRVLTSLADDNNHFHPAYFGRGVRWHRPLMGPLTACYRKALDVYREHGRTLLNATAGGALEEIPRISFASLL